MSEKENSFKEKLREALTSTAKVISDDYRPKLKKTNDNLSSKNPNFFEIDNLSNKYDFTKLRAEADSAALKIKFSNKDIYNKNLYSAVIADTLDSLGYHKQDLTTGFTSLDPNVIIC